MATFPCLYLVMSSAGATTVVRFPLRGARSSAGYSGRRTRYYFPCSAVHFFLFFSASCWQSTEAADAAEAKRFAEEWAAFVDKVTAFGKAVLSHVITDYETRSDAVRGCVILRFHTYRRVPKFPTR